MFGIVLTSVCTILHGYVFWRIASIPTVKRYFSGRAIFLVGLVLWLVFLSSRYIGRDREGFTWTVLELVGMHWMAVLFLLFCFLLASDLLTGFGFLFRRWIPIVRGLMLSAGIIISIIANVQGFRAPTVTLHKVCMKDLPKELDGFKIAAISDTHIGTLLSEHWLLARIDQIMGLNPDLVVLLGDIVEGHGRSLDLILPQLKKLSAPSGGFAVLGNHDFHGGQDSGADLLRSAGFTVLRDQWKEVRPGLIIAGVDDSRVSRWDKKEYNPLEHALATHPEGATILLSHRPKDVEKAADRGVDLMLCGHTHGGQIWPLDYLVRLSYPLLEGRYEVGNMPIIVNRGAGTWGPRMRFPQRGEILLITLCTDE